MKTNIFRPLNKYRFYIFGVFVLILLFGGGFWLSSNYQQKKVIVDHESVTELRLKTGLERRVASLLLYKYDLIKGNTVEEIRSNLGNPLKIEENYGRNLHNPDITDKLITLYYDGMKIEIYRASYDKKEVLISVEIASDKHAIDYGLNVGVAKQKVIDTLGDPSSTEGNEMIYQLEMDTIRFTIQKDRVRKICWLSFL